LHPIASTKRGRRSAEKARPEAETLGVKQQVNLPDDILLQVLGKLPQNDVFAFAMVCKQFRDVQKVFTRSKPFRTSAQQLVRDVERGNTVLSRDRIKFSYVDITKKRRDSKRQFVVQMAAAHGYTDTLQWLKDNRCPMYRTSSFIYIGAARLGQLEAIKWLRNEGCKWDRSAYTFAAMGGHLNVMKYLRSQRCPWSEDACFEAVGGGHLHVLRWAYDSGLRFPLFSNQLSMIAAREGYMDILEWLLEVRVPIGPPTWKAATARGRLEVLQWLQDHNIPRPEGESLCNIAARSGRINVLEWARAQGMPWNESTCIEAAAEGELETLKYLRRGGCPWNEESCSWAAFHGDVRILQWLRSQEPPCPWDEGSCQAAAAGGNLECLQWMRREGCPWDACVCYAAAEEGHLDLLKWSKSHGVPWQPDRVAEIASINNQDAVLDWLRSQGIRTPPKPTILRIDLGTFQGLGELLANFPGFPGPPFAM